MASSALKSFLHPHGVYRLQYPAAWEQLDKDDARSCGFGPRERDDVGLWISIMPMSVDTDRLIQDLPKLMQQVLAKEGDMRGANMRKDESLKNFGLKADLVKEGEAGHYWILAGGDVVLFASSQVPAAERDVWNPVFADVMASLRITREDALLFRKVANDVLEKLRTKYPDQEFEHDDRGIRGKERQVYLGNLIREIRESPKRQEEIINHFVEGLGQSVDADMGHEQWEDIQHDIIPMLKPREYIRTDTPTKHLHINEWLVEVVICYAIRNKKFFRFVTGWDIRRWGTNEDELHELAIQNLRRLPWPKRLEGSRQHDGGRLILVLTNDSLASSRLLHPDLHHLFREPLGSPFWAGIPDRDTLVLFSDRKNLKQRMARQLKKDFHASAYAITAKPFLVTADGIAPGGD